MAKLTHPISPAPSALESLPLPGSWSASNLYLSPGINTVNNASRLGAKPTLFPVLFAGSRSSANEACLGVWIKEPRKRLKNWVWNVETVVGRVRTWCFWPHLICNRIWTTAICLETITTARTTSHAKTWWSKKKKSTRICKRQSLSDSSMSRRRKSLRNSSK